MSNKRIDPEMVIWLFGMAIGAVGGVGAGAIVTMMLFQFGVLAT